MSQAKVLSETEIKRVLAVVAQHGKHAARNRLLVQLSVLGGMRAGEIAALRINNVLNEDGQIRDRIHLSVEQTKGKKGRTVIIGKKLQKEIQNYVSGFRYLNPNAPLIQSQKGKGFFSPTTIVMLFRRIYNEAGIPDARSHSGRRSYITKLANKGVSVFVLQKLAGHKNIGTTQQYVTVNEEMMMEAAELA